MSQILVVVGTQSTPLPTLASGVKFAAIAVTVTDNSGQPAKAPDGTTAVLLTGQESTPWTVTFTGVDGSSEASFSAQALDSTGANLGAALVVTESGTGGVIPGTFPQPVAAGSSITVTG
jgi:hypothetical protein